MESLVQSFLHPNFHHQIVYEKVKLKMYYPQTYECEVWHYQTINIAKILKICWILSIWLEGQLTGLNGRDTC